MTFEDLKDAREDWIVAHVFKHTVRIVWGSETELRRGSSYSFKTEAELEAFLYGVDEANGWLDYEIKEENDD